MEQSLQSVMVKLKANNGSWSLLGTILAEYGMTSSHQSVVFIANVKWYRIDEATRIYIVLFDCPLVPDFVYGSVV